MSRPYGTPTAAKSTTSLLSTSSSNSPSRQREEYPGDSSSRSLESPIGGPPSFSEKFSLGLSPASWGAPLHIDTPEPDDFLHNPDPRRDRNIDSGGHIFTLRGLGNLGCLLFLALGILTLFAGFPLITHFTKTSYTTQGGFNLGGINATGQIASIPGNYGLIDKDTPKDAYTRTSYHKQEEFILVFSDEFEQEGRTFWPGDDPYWEAVDLHYWGTNDKEWYDPHQVTTKGGALQIRMDKVDDTSINHDMPYRSGMLQSWNKFCFTGGLIEVSVRLPGSSEVNGLWPGVWTLGNLGRAGYGASVEGLWPYSYDSCDVGTLPNQTYPGTRTPIAALENGDKQNGDALSYLSGQRLSACTCPGESHPGPMRTDGTYVGRSSPEIDILEATVEDGVGKVSQSAQWAPFNAGYQTPNTTGFMDIEDPDITVINTYRGGAFQQTTSGLAKTNQSCYELSGGCFAIYGFEYKPGFDEGYVTWWNNNVRSWTVYGKTMAADKLTEISERPVPLEPLTIVINLALSENFGAVAYDRLIFPTTMSVDYVRVYQPKDAVNTGCDPTDFPTAAYIETYKEAYTNNNLTTWAQYGEAWPKNRLMQPGQVCPK